jgi:CRISPR system Cascade subunit CasE
MTLHMIQMSPDMVATAAWARQNGVASADDGYLIHALLTANFGPQAPKPFALMAKPGRPSKVLAYSPHSAAHLRDQAQMFAEPAALEAAGVQALASKVMPAAFAQGAQLGFEVRVRPVIRLARGAGEDAGKERDAFLAALRDVAEDAKIDRMDVYRQWLARAMSTGASILRAEPLYQRLTPVTRRGRETEDGGRPLAHMQGPDVCFSGLLRIETPEAFAALLARGVGRHRAFGFGMLLLRPPE